MSRWPVFVVLNNVESWFVMLNDVYQSEAVFVMLSDIDQSKACVCDAE